MKATTTPAAVPGPILNQAARQALLTDHLDVAEREANRLWPSVRYLGIDRDDLYHEAVLAMCRCRDEYDPARNDNFRGYCTRPIRNALVDFLRRWTRVRHDRPEVRSGAKKPPTFVPLLNEEHDRAGSTPDPATRALLHDSVHLLTEDLEWLERVILVLRYHGDHDWEAIGNALGMTTLRCDPAVDVAAANWRNLVARDVEPDEWP